MRTILLFFLLCLCIIQPQAGLTDTSSISTEDHGFAQIFHIPLRVHLGKSDRPPDQWPPILEEINRIWKSQAGICFDMHTVMHDEPIEQGFDLWFHSTIPDWNGYFTGRHDMHVRDNPDLRPAENPANSSAARTAAHELGHALNLGHRQNSDDNLMRSKTYGWQLNEQEILQARETADQPSFITSNRNECLPIMPINP